GYTLGVVLSPTVAGGVAGATIGTHGLDQVWSGVQSLRQGEKVDAYTSQLMQSAGISRDKANRTNDMISFATTVMVGVINVRSLSAPVTASKDVGGVADDIAGWLGKDAKVITNKAGDKIFLSKEGTKRFRFDIKNPHPHKSPHGHVEILKNGKWKKSGPIYPKDVPKH
ncbi:MAG: hypothetical protein KAR13_01360, partial [Desulfobulbaceae bacterium]|nr:hypothetical protein [Desulfobulbaceae bacterium]